MTRSKQLAFICLALAVGGLATLLFSSSDFASSFHAIILWVGFLVGVPLLLGGLLYYGYRWVLMVAVFYGTTGLALDISTIVQVLTQSGNWQNLGLSMITGLLNFLLITLGGRAFLNLKVQ